MGNMVHVLIFSEDGVRLATNTVCMKHVGQNGIRMVSEESFTMMVPITQENSNLATETDTVSLLEKMARSNKETGKTTTSLAELCFI